jgi:hydrogenase maturation factor
MISEETLLAEIRRGAQVALEEEPLNPAVKAILQLIKLNAEELLSRSLVVTVTVNQGYADSVLEVCR